jgi:membrane fusion protein (multidrug efflux system)
MVFLWVYLLFSASPTRAAVEAKPKPQVFVSQVKAKELFDQFVYPARVVSKVNSTILADSDGVVSRIYAPLGQKVSARARILQITHTDPVYQYAPIQVTAPAAGIVSSVEITEGAQVVKGQKLATVTDPRQTKIQVEVPALDLPSVQPGLEGEFMPTGAERPLKVRVLGISPYVDPATGTAGCEIVLDKSEKTQLVPGVLGQVNFKANLRKGFMIPDSAVLYKGAATFIRLVQDGKAKQVPVTLGRKQRGNVEILKGLNEDASLVERSSRYIGDGEEVNVQTSGS